MFKCMSKAFRNVIQILYKTLFEQFVYKDTKRSS